MTASTVVEWEKLKVLYKEFKIPFHDGRGGHLAKRQSTGCLAVSARLVKGVMLPNFWFGFSRRVL